MSLTNGMDTPLEIKTDLTIEILLRFIQEEVAKVGFKKVVIGLSGGIDSAVAAFLAARALGADNVHAILMPYKTSSSESLSDALLVTRKLEIQYTEIPITPMVDSFFKLVECSSQLRRGNVMARMRMIVLYDQSEAHQSLVMGTSNKTELLLGYGTLWGDMASALNPLGDLYKTQIQSLADALGVPDSIIAKPPSADLWEGQNDESELGFAYSLVDKLLFYFIDKRYTPRECIELGFEPEFVKKVITRVQRTQFKRRMPVIAKLSQRTIDRDFRYARDWGY